MYAGPSNHKSHQICSPNNPNQQIWRFQDFAKFVSLLKIRSLHFCRIDKFKDPFEGELPVTYVEKYRERLRKTGVHSEAAIKGMTDGIIRVHKLGKKWHYANCWHINKVESEAMWKLYTTGNEGIAIQSTFKRLKHSLPEEEDDSRRVYIGKIKYIDYDQEDPEKQSSLACSFQKRLNFDHERELRAIIHHEKLGKNGGPIQDTPKETGLSVKVNLDKLIEKVYVSPMSQKWFHCVVKSVMKKYGLEKELCLSRLAEKPHF